MSIQPTCPLCGEAMHHPDECPADRLNCDILNELLLCRALLRDLLQEYDPYRELNVRIRARLAWPKEVEK
jgi:hypothetical protein